MVSADIVRRLVVDEATGDGDDARGQGLGPLQFVGGNEHGGPSAYGTTDHVVEQVTAVGVEAGMRFVEQPESGAAGDEAGERCPAALTRGQPTGGHGCKPAVEPQLCESGVDLAIACPGGAAPEPDVLPNGEVRIQTVLVAEQAHVLANRRPIGLQVVTEHLGIAPDEGHQPCTEAQQRGLSGTVRPLQEQHLAGLHLERGTGQSGESAEHGHHMTKRNDRRRCGDGGAGRWDGLHGRHSTLDGTGGERVDRCREGDPPLLGRLTDGTRTDPIGSNAVDDGGVQDQHPQPVPNRRDWRWALGIIGRSFIVLGLLILAFVAYQLWGTSIEFRSNQSELAKDFRRAVDSVTTTRTPSTTSQDSGVAPTSAVATTVAPTTSSIVEAPPVGEGDVLAALTFPTLSDKPLYVVAGVRLVDLKRGIGHYPGTSLPGQYGNAALAGHRTTYGAPFENIDRLAPGDPIIIETSDGGRFEYIVDSQEIIQPSEVGVLSQPKDPGDALLTLTTCHPKRSTKRRLVVHAHLNFATSSKVGARSANYRTPTAVTTGPGATTTPSTIAGESVTPDGASDSTVGPSTTPAPTVPASIAGGDEVNDEDARDLAAGWFKDTAAWPQIILWGLLLAGIAVGGYLLGIRLRRRWLGALISSAPFIVVLYFFFQNINRLLPPGL